MVVYANKLKDNRREHMSSILRALLIDSKPPHEDKIMEI